MENQSKSGKLKEVFNQIEQLEKPKNQGNVKLTPEE